MAKTELYEADRLKRSAIRDEIASRISDLTDHIGEIENALEIASDTEEDAESREAARDDVIDALRELLDESEALIEFCDDRLVA